MNARELFGNKIFRVVGLGEMHYVWEDESVERSVRSKSNLTSRMLQGGFEQEEEKPRFRQGGVMMGDITFYALLTLN